MNITLFNIEWMSYNILLALVAIIFGFLMFKSKSTVGRSVFGILWFVFIPNTIYMITDIVHIPKQFTIQENIIIRMVLLIQYLLLIAISIITFIVALYPFEKMIMSFIKGSLQKRINITYLIIFMFNFLIALGVALGRFQRVNSWEAFTNTEYVIHQTAKLLKSSEFVIIILLGLLSNIIYFSLKKTVLLIFSSKTVKMLMS